MIDQANPSGGLSRADMADMLAAESTDDLQLELAPEDISPDGMEIDLATGLPVDGDAANDEPLLNLDVPHNANLAASLSDDCRRKIVQEIFQAVSQDDSAREEWIQSYRQALKLLGFTYETVSEPWEGASSSVHPMLAASTVAFQARSIKTLFPASGPVKGKVIGAATQFKMNSMARAVTALNALMTKHRDYRIELEKALFVCGLAGSGFSKTWKDHTTGRAKTGGISPEDLILSPDASCIDDAARATHVLRKHYYEIREAVAADVYIDVVDKLQERSPTDQGPAGTNTLSSTDIDEERAKISGVDNLQDQRFVLHEVYLRLNLADYDEQYIEWDNPDGVPRPYVLTYDSETLEMLALYRNWEEADLAEKPIQPITQYQYLVSHLSPYGLGLMHLIGQTTENVTAILRNLTDAGTLANLQAGYKSRGLRTREENIPLRPGEFRDVDVASGKIADNIYQLQFKEPSPTLLQLMQGMEAKGEALAALASTSLEDLPHNAASFAVLAILEREIEPQAAVHIRLHASWTHQLQQIADITAEMTPDYEIDVDGDPNTPNEPGLKARDFTAAEFVPVSNPNEASSGTKLLKVEVVKQLAEKYPGQFDEKELVRYCINLMGEPDFDRVLKQDQPPPQLDPISENMNLMTGKPVLAYLDQDHEAHIRVHMAAINDPKLQAMMQNNPAAGQMMAAANAHVMEHMAFAYRRQMERQLGVPLPPAGQPMDPSQEARLSSLAADAAEMLLGMHQKEEALKQAQDPVFQLQKQEADNESRKLDIDERDKTTKNRIEMAKVILDAAEKDQQLEFQGIDAGVKVLGATANIMSNNRKNATAEQGMADKRDAAAAKTAAPKKEPK